MICSLISWQKAQETYLALLKNEKLRRMHANGAAQSWFSTLLSPTLCSSSTFCRHLLAYLHPFYLCPPCRRSRTPSLLCCCFFFLSPDNLKGRQLLHTTYKMFMTAAGVEGKSFCPEQTHKDPWGTPVNTLDEEEEEEEEAAPLLHLMR